MNSILQQVQESPCIQTKVIAEGVEDDKQLQFLGEHGCDEVQGFIYSKPLPAEDIEREFLETES